MNTLVGKIVAIAASKHLSLLKVAVGGDTLSLLLAEHAIETIGAEVTLVFKETEVILSLEAVNTSANLCQGVVSRIETGEILTSVTLAYHESAVDALISTAHFKQMHCHIGKTIFWIVNPSEISLKRSAHER